MSTALVEARDCSGVAVAPSDEGGSRSALGPFMLGTVVGGVLGAIVGTALSPHTRGFMVGLYHLVNRRLTSAERDRLRFELSASVAPDVLRGNAGDGQAHVPSLLRPAAGIPQSGRRTSFRTRA